MCPVSGHPARGYSRAPEPRAPVGRFLLWRVPYGGARALPGASRGDPVSARALAALASRTVGRRVELSGGIRGTVTRVTGRGYVVTVPNLTHDDVTFLDD